jgi:hypothetical protein
VILVIDTSSTATGVALVSAGSVLTETVHDSGRSLDLAAVVQRLVDVARLEAVAVATGPGSFTGLRTGAAYALGLALGRRIPLLALGSLELQRGRARSAATAVVEAGRGRVYYLTGAGDTGLVAAAGLPGGDPAVGWLRTETARALPVPLLAASELRTFGEAAAAAVGGAEKVAYDRVSLRYMQSFGWQRSGEPS